METEILVKKTTDTFSFALLPKDIAHLILSFDKRFKIRKGTLVDVIPFDDPRRDVINRAPRIDPHGHVMLTDNEHYEIHVMVATFDNQVRWTMYKYFKNIDEEEIMEGFVFSMDRIAL
jgi:hypothetical protein